MILGPADIGVFFFSCNRQARRGIEGGRNVAHGKNYIYDAIDSLHGSGLQPGAISIVPGMPSGDYLDRYHGTDVHIYNLPDNRKVIPPGKGLKCNYMRTLRLAYESELPGVIICEDDILFCGNFLDYALDAINEMRCHQLPKANNILSFYSTLNPLSSPECYRGEYFCSYVGWQFAGLCAWYHDRATLNPIAHYISEHFNEAPADLLVGDWSRINYTRYRTPTSLVQHVGGVSSGTSGGWEGGAFRFGEPRERWAPKWQPIPYERFFLRSK